MLYANSATRMQWICIVQCDLKLNNLLSFIGFIIGHSQPPKCRSLWRFTAFFSTSEPHVKNSCWKMISIKKQSHIQRTKAMTTMKKKTSLNPFLAENHNSLFLLKDGFWYPFNFEWVQIKMLDQILFYLLVKKLFGLWPFYAIIDQKSYCLPAKWHYWLFSRLLSLVTQMSKMSEK